MDIRIIDEQLIHNAVHEAIKYLSYHPDPAIKSILQISLANESNDLRIDVLDSLIQNIELSPRISIPLCQDTGTLVVFVELGNYCIIKDKPIDAIINDALIEASADLYLRASIVYDPLFNRSNTNNNYPAIVHTRIVEGDKLRLKLAQKGGGAENMSCIRMMLPTSTEQDVIDFVVETVKQAGAKACPPVILGVGIGGNFEQCALMAKEALLNPIGTINSDAKYAKLENSILTAINSTGIGAQGMGGDLTALSVHIKQAPCHIASLPVAVNIQCHAHRHIEIEL
jgi:fumarate hydratase subunit alpha